MDEWMKSEGTEHNKVMENVFSFIIALCNNRPKWHGRRRKWDNTICTFSCLWIRSSTHVSVCLCSDSQVAYLFMSGHPVWPVLTAPSILRQIHGLLRWSYVSCRQGRSQAGDIWLYCDYVSITANIDELICCLVIWSWITTHYHVSGEYYV